MDAEPEHKISLLTIEKLRAVKKFMDEALPFDQEDYERCLWRYNRDFIIENYKLTPDAIAEFDKKYLSVSKD